MRIVAVGLLVGSLTRGAGPVAAYDEMPDLTIRMVDVWGTGQYANGGFVEVETTYVLKVQNPVGREFDLEFKEWLPVGSADAGDVVVQSVLPVGVVFRSATGTNNFRCSHAAGVVTCSGGTIEQGASATIYLSVSPARGSLFSATVDPFDAIEERDESNNSVRWWG
ncbi:MAG: hypothetical protein HY331_06565 [Chloroflexi bacterium]|nr:hypothetical protein [Chloroflexota bacterium]